MGQSDEQSRIPLISVDSSAVDAFGIFNPNDWRGSSKDLVLACSTKLSMAHFTAESISQLCRERRELCQAHVERLGASGGITQANLQKVDCYAQVPTLHMSIETFFSVGKGLLDLLAQLLSSESIVNSRIDGFHRTRSVYGGKVINALRNNANGARTAAATAVVAVVQDHKNRWIDEFVRARDMLIHPKHAFHQVMFQLRLSGHGADLVLKGADPPPIADVPADQYCADRIAKLCEFSSEFLHGVRAV